MDHDDLEPLPWRFTRVACPVAKNIAPTIISMMWAWWQSVGWVIALQSSTRPFVRIDHRTDEALEYNILMGVFHEGGLCQISFFKNKGLPITTTSSRLYTCGEAACYRTYLDSLHGVLPQHLSQLAQLAPSTAAITRYGICGVYGFMRVGKYRSRIWSKSDRLDFL